MKLDQSESCQENPPITDWQKSTNHRLTKIHQLEIGKNPPIRELEGKSTNHRLAGRGEIWQNGKSENSLILEAMAPMCTAHLGTKVAETKMHSVEFKSKEIVPKNHFCA